MLIVVGGIKGGSGKTTVATNLAVWCARNKKKTLLVDADDQKSTTSWSEQREGNFVNECANEFDLNPEKERILLSGERLFPTISMSGKFCYQQLQRLKQDFEVVVVDTGGRDTTTQRSALTVADKFLVPFKPRSLDVWTLGDVKRLIDEIQVVNPNLKSLYVINQGDARGTDNNDAMELIKEMKCMEAVPTIIGYRKAFSNAASQGLGVWELEKPDEKANNEMEECARFVYQYDISNISV